MNEYLNRVGQPAQTVNRGPADNPVQPRPSNGKKRKFSFNLSRVLFVVFSVLIAVVLIGSLYLLIFGNKGTIASQIKTNQYQAVFLNSSDGQVYFGKLSVLNRDYYKLTDIYYVRVQTVQPDKSTTSSSQQNISLAKLGSEIHGPEDVMFINRNSVMFWENLKEDGQVVKAIREYQKNPTSSTNNSSNNSNSSTKSGN